MRRGYPNPTGTGMRFNFSSPLGMGRVMGKYMKIGYGNGEGQIRPHPAPLPCLVLLCVTFFLKNGFIICHLYSIQKD